MHGSLSQMNINASASYLGLAHRRMCEAHATRMAHCIMRVEGATCWRTHLARMLPCPRPRDSFHGRGAYPAVEALCSSFRGGRHVPEVRADRSLRSLPGCAEVISAATRLRTRCARAMSDLS